MPVSIEVRWALTGEWCASLLCLESDSLQIVKEKLQIPTETPAAFLHLFCEDGLTTLEDEQCMQELTSRCLLVARRDIEDIDNFFLNAISGCPPDLQLIGYLLRNYATRVLSLRRGSHTVLHIAAANGHSEVCLRLLECGEELDINAKNVMSRTALHLAAKGEMTEICLALVRDPRFVEINALDCDSRTALHWAALRGMLEVSRAITSACAFTEVNALDREETTALGLATDMGHNQVIELLLHSKGK